VALLAGRTVFNGRKGRVAGVGGVAALGACLLLSACGSVQMGAAAIVGNQRITQATLDSQISNFEEASANYPGQVQVTSADAPSAVLSWLIRFAIENRMASDAGITVSETEIQAGVASVNQEIAEEQEEEGGAATSPTVGLLNAGLPPQLSTELGQYQAQLDAFAAKANGGTLPSTTAQNNAVTTAVSKAQCTAAKSLNIRVNPQYGVFNYSEYAVETGSTTNTLSAPSGKPTKPSTSGLTPAC
jgi:hypothetical protein